MITGLRRQSWFSGLGVFLLGTLSGTGLSGAWNAAKAPASRTLLDNNKVQVTRVEYDQAAIRTGHTRPHDQVIVFLDDARYEVAYRDGKKERRERRSGDVIWHNRGEEAPNLTNIGASYRTVVVNLK